jgi:hypothetical protein
MKNLPSGSGNPSFHNMSDVFAQTAPQKQRAFPNLNRGSKPKSHTNIKVLAEPPEGTTWPEDTPGYTPYRAAFVDAFFDSGGFAPDAMRAVAGPEGSHNHPQLLKNPNVLRAIARRAAIIAKGANITPEDVIESLQRIGNKAEDAGQYAPAIKAQELIGKQLGMFIERSLNINVDATQAHLHALKAKMEARKTSPKLIGQASTVDPFAGL